jgi:hypothetical protein
MAGMVSLTIIPLGVIGSVWCWIRFFRLDCLRPTGSRTLGTDLHICAVSVNTVEHDSQPIGTCPIDFSSTGTITPGSAE